MPVVVTPSILMATSAPYVLSMSGSVDEFGGLHPGDLYPGDNKKDNVDFEGFVTFDISSIPADAVIDSALLSFDSCQENGFPFHDFPFGLGELHIDILYYGDLDSSDYASDGGELVANIDNCFVEAVDLSSALSAVLGHEYMQLRLYFDEGNKDNYRDDIVLTGPTLIIVYPQ